MIRSCTKAHVLRWMGGLIAAMAVLPRLGLACSRSGTVGRTHLAGRPVTVEGRDGPPDPAGVDEQESARLEGDGQFPGEEVFDPAHWRSTAAMPRTLPASPCAAAIDSGVVQRAGSFSRRVSRADGRSARADQAGRAAWTVWLGGWSQRAA